MIRKTALALLMSLAMGGAAQAADRLTVLLEWFVNPDHAPLVVARELGLFEKAGLEVELLPPSDPSIVPRAVASGQADIGIHYQPNLYLDHAAGVPLVRFGTLVETPLNTLTVLAGDGRLKRFLEAVEQGAVHLTNHPEEGWALFVRAYPDLDDALNRQAWVDTLPRFAKRPLALDRARYARFGAFMAGRGLIGEAPAVEDIAVELE